MIQREPKERPVVILADGHRVKFTLKKRPGQPHYFVVFRDRDNERLERSTKECNKKRATDSAAQKIKEAYDPDATITSLRSHPLITSKHRGFVLNA
jgi:hypothetical protein